MSCRGGKSAQLVDDAGWAKPGSTRASSETRTLLRSNHPTPLISFPGPARDIAAIRRSPARRKPLRTSRASPRHAGVDLIGGLPANLFNLNNSPASAGPSPIQRSRLGSNCRSRSMIHCPRIDSLVRAATLVVAASLAAGCADGHHVDVMTVMSQGNCQTEKTGVQVIDYTTLAAYRGAHLID